VIPLELHCLSHFKASAILGYEYAIGVRSGCFCAHPYILHLLGLTHEQANTVRHNILSGDRSDMPGLIRASFGLYNSFDDVDAFVDALTQIADGKYQGKYVQNKLTGEYFPEDWKPGFESYFSFDQKSR